MFFVARVLVNQRTTCARKLIYPNDLYKNYNYLIPPLYISWLRFCNLILYLFRCFKDVVSIFVRKFLLIATEKLECF